MSGLGVREIAGVAFELIDHVRIATQQKNSVTFDFNGASPADMQAG